MNLNSGPESLSGTQKILSPQVKILPTMYSSYASGTPNLTLPKIYTPEQEVISYSQTSVAFEGEKEGLTVAIYPDESGKNIANIDGKYRDITCTIGEKELKKIPRMLKGAGVHLSDKIKTNISGKINPDGNFTIFINSLATTLVEFKLVGKIFPESGITKISPRIFNYETLNNLSKLAQDNEKLAKWIEKIIKFWNQWKFMFKDLDKKDYLEDLVDEQAKQIESLKREMESMKRDIAALKTLIYNESSYPIS
jgi:hypothetical protein